MQTILKRLFSLLLALVLLVGTVPMSASATENLTSIWQTDLTMSAAELGVNASDPVLRATLTLAADGHVTADWEAVNLTAFRIFFHDMFVNAYYAMAYGAGITDINEIEQFCLDSTGMTVSAYMDTIVTEQAITAAFTPASTRGLYMVDGSNVYLDMDLMGITSNPEVPNPITRGDGALYLNAVSFGKGDLIFICRSIDVDPEEPGPAPEPTEAPTLPEDPFEPSQPVNPDFSFDMLALITESNDPYSQELWRTLGTWLTSTSNQTGASYRCEWQVTNDQDTAEVITRVESVIANGADVVIFPGYHYGAALVTLMDRYPNVRFIALDMGEGDLTEDYVNYRQPSANTACITFAEEQAGFLAGYAAVYEHYYDFGFLGGMPVPAVQRYGAGFIQGVNCAAEEIGTFARVKYNYTNTFYATPEATALATNWYSDRTDIIMACGGSLYGSVVEAAEATGKLVIGTDTDLSQVSHNVMISAVKDLGAAACHVLDALMVGDWERYGGQVTRLGLEDGPFLGLAGWRFNSFTGAQYEALRSSIADGALYVDPEYEYYFTSLSNTTVTRDDGTTEVPPATEAPTTPPTAEPVTLKVWMPRSDQHDESAWLPTMIHRFEQAHPDYDITWDVGVCSPGDASILVINDPANTADIYLYSNDQMGALVEAGALASVRPSSVSQTSLDTVTYQDGNIYGFPIYSNTWFMYYDKSVYSESDVRSLDTMLEKGTVSFPMDNSWYTGAFLFGAGGTLFGAKGNNPSAGVQMTSYTCVDAAKYMVRLAAHPNFVNDIDGIGVEDMIDGTVNAVFSGTWEAARLYDAMGDDLGIAVLPTFTAGGATYQMKAFASSHAIGVNPNAAHPALATEFAAFLASPESVQLRSELSSGYPAPIADELHNAVKAVMESASVAQPTIPEMANYWDPMRTFGVNILNGNITEANVVQSLYNTVNQIRGNENETERA